MVFLSENYTVFRFFQCDELPFSSFYAYYFFLILFARSFSVNECATHVNTSINQYLLMLMQAPFPPANVKVPVANPDNTNSISLSVTSQAPVINAPPRTVSHFPWSKPDRITDQCLADDGWQLK